MTARPAALIVGGGPAGAAVAVALAAAGRSVILLEREAGPHDKVCGAFLSQEATLYLDALGIDLPALGAQPIDRVRLAVGNRVTVMTLPFSALSLSRRALDAALLRRAASMGAEIRMGAKVQTLAFQDGAWCARLQDGEAVMADDAFLATGKHDLRGWGRPERAQTDFIGFKLHWRLTPPELADLDRHVELMLFRGGYAGLERVEEDRVNLCLVVRRSRFAELGQQWEALLAAIRTSCPLLDRRLDGARPCSDRPLAVSRIPYGYVRRKSDGPWHLGDQAAVIPSFSGDGMSIALHSARLAASSFLKGARASDYQLRLARDVALPLRFASLISAASLHPVGQALTGRAMALAPRGIAGIAAATRVPAAALRRAGLDPA